MVKRLEMNHKGLPEFDENGTWVFFTDYAALQQNLNAMAAENAALKKSLKGTVEWCYSDDLPETPATDAYLNSVRAEGVDSFQDWLRDEADIFDRNSEHLWADENRVAADKAKIFAEQLRSGSHDTTDKEG